MRYKVFSGSTHPSLTQAICKHLKIKQGKILIERFACNEIYIKSDESVRGEHVFIIQTCTQNINEDYMELFLICDSMKRSFAKSVHVILPHFGYARQDRIAEPRETISAKLMADLLVQSGADHVVAFALHSDQIQGFFDVPVDNVKTHGLFVDYFKKKKLKNPVIVSPDVGGAREAKKLADALGCRLAILHKTRPQHNVSEVTHIVGDVKGKTAILYDDMIDTGGSVCNAKAALDKSGANKDIYLAATHPVFSGNAVSKLDKAGFKEVVVTDSIPLEKERTFKSLRIIPLAPLIANIIKNVSLEKSVSGLHLKKG
jgi:ribose-phosphate pyrophosphokinase